MAGILLIRRKTQNNQSIILILSNKDIIFSLDFLFVCLGVFVLFGNGDVFSLELFAVNKKAL